MLYNLWNLWEHYILAPILHEKGGTSTSCTVAAIVVPPIFVSPLTLHIPSLPLLYNTTCTACYISDSTVMWQDIWLQNWGGYSSPHCPHLASISATV